MKGPSDSRPVVSGKHSNPVSNIIEIFPGDGLLTQKENPADKPRLRLPAHVHHDLDQILHVRLVIEG